MNFFPREKYDEILLVVVLQGKYGVDTRMFAEVVGESRIYHINLDIIQDIYIVDQLIDYALRFDNHHVNLYTDFKDKYLKEFSFCEEV